MSAATGAKSRMKLQGIREIEFLADPTVGELRMMCDESIAAATLPRIVRRFTQDHPGAILNVEPFDRLAYASKLRDRVFDLALTRRPQPDPERDPLQELDARVLFEDALVVAAGERTRWARRRRIDLAELAQERWILTPPGTLNYEIVAEAFRTRGLAMPRVSLRTMSVYLRTNLLETGDFITAFPRSVLDLHAQRFSLHALRVDLPVRAWPVVLVTLKNRTMSPIVEHFVACAREVAAQSGHAADKKSMR